MGTVPQVDCTALPGKVVAGIEEGIGMGAMVRIEVSVTQFDEALERIAVAYVEIQRVRLLAAIPSWVPYRQQIAERWPERWLPGVGWIKE